MRKREEGGAESEERWVTEGNMLGKRRRRELEAGGKMQKQDKKRKTAMDYDQALFK